MNKRNNIVRPSTSSAAHRPVTSSSTTRPGTSAGRSASLGSFGSTSLESPDLFLGPSTTLQREVNSDSLLRILNEPNARDTNSIILCADKGDLPGVLRVIRSVLDINKCKGLNGFTPIHHASNRGHATIVNELLKAGMNVNIKNDDGETPLHSAAYSGHLLIVEQLLDGCADVEARNNYGETPLFYAARKGLPAVVRLLLQRGANVHSKDDIGETAEDHAVDKRTKAVLNTFHSIEAPSSISYNNLLHVFRFLAAKDIGVAACVAGKWHRASECQELWSKLKVRRWEFSLQSSLGFGPVPTASYRPKVSSVKPPKPIARQVNSR